MGVSTRWKKSANLLRLRVSAFGRSRPRRYANCVIHPVRVSCEPSWMGCTTKSNPCRGGTATHRTRYIRSGGKRLPLFRHPACCLSGKLIVLTERQRCRLCVVLVRTRNPLNIGAAARAMSNFGFDQLRVVEPYELAFREARSAVGAAELLKTSQQYENVTDTVADCSLVIGT